MVNIKSSGAKFLIQNLLYSMNFRKFWTKRKLNFGKYSIVKPGTVSAKKAVPLNINKPLYYETGIPIVGPAAPEIKTEEQIVGMRASCKLAANILNEIGKSIHVGQTTDEVDTFAHNLIIKNNSYPSPLNYKMYPKSICTSVNNVACHGIPDDRPLENGDIMNIDVTIFFNGYHGDCSKTLLIGNVDKQGCALVMTTEKILNEAVSICEPGQYFSSIGALIQKRAKRFGFAVVPAFIGHGIGQYFHGPPDIYHIRNRYPGTMEAGMTFTIEPVLSQGSIEIEILEDQWTAVTIDNSRTAQFEHTILITKTGVEILTLPD